MTAAVVWVRCSRLASFLSAPFLALSLAVLLNIDLSAQAASARAPSAAPELQQAVRTGNLALVRARLQAGDSPNARDAAQRTPLINAVRAGQLGIVRILLRRGADVNAADVNGVTALIEAADEGHPKTAALLIQAGADLNVRARGQGTALNAAERAGHRDIVAMLRRAGAQTTGKSVGDKVCVRPWSGDGYCGTVESSNKNAFQIRVSDIVGCSGGCPTKAGCSDGRPVGGSFGIKVGDVVNTFSWCLTDTGGQQ